MTLSVDTTNNVPALTKSDSVARWYASATVRKTERIIVPTDQRREYIYPRARQVMSEHPLVLAKGWDAISFVLTQSAYKYMYEIGLLETRFVTDCALNIVNNRIGTATDDEKREALTIVIDEGYHAYVALDYIVQTRAATKIEPVEIPETNGNLTAVHAFFARLAPEFHMDFQLISVCLAEHTLTRDLLSIGKEKETALTFTQVMTDHVSDEGRHANYFARMMKNHWADMSEESRLAIGPGLAPYLDDYLADDFGRSFDRKVLTALAFSGAEIEQIISDTDATYRSRANDYITKTKANLVKLLARCEILAHGPTRAAFEAQGIVV